MDPVLQGEAQRRLTLRPALPLMITFMLALSGIAWVPGADAFHPYGDFTYAPSSPKPNETIQFTDQSNGAGVIVNWTWDFGDGNVSYVQHPTHSYPAEGDYTVLMTPRDDWGEIGSTATKIVSVAYADPTASFTHTPDAPSTADQVDFTDTSTDLDHDLVNWTWDLGDGNSSYEQHPNHTYAAAGDYTVALTVTDTRGGSGTTNQIVSVSNRLPIAGFTHSPEIPTTGQTVLFTDGSSDADGTIVNRTWDHGDGNTSYGPNPSHSYTAAGTYTVTLTVTDNDGGTATNATDLTILPRPSGGGGGGGGYTIPIGTIIAETKARATASGWTSSASLPPSVKTFTTTFTGDSPVQKVTLYTKGSGPLRVDIKHLSAADIGSLVGFEPTDTFDISVWTSSGISYEPGVLELRPSWAIAQGIDPKQLVTLHQSDNEWRMVLSAPDADGHLHAYTPDFSPFAIAIDTSAPSLDAAGTEGVLSSGAIVALSASDNRGIRSVTATLDGTVLPVEQDGDDRWFEIPADLPTGTYTLTVVAEDLSSLSTTKEWTLQVSGAAATDSPQEQTLDETPVRPHTEQEAAESPGIALAAVIGLVACLGVLLRRRR